MADNIYRTSLHCANSYSIPTVSKGDTLGTWKRAVRNDGCVEFKSPEIRFTNRTVNQTSSVVLPYFGNKSCQEEVKFCYLFGVDRKLKVVTMETGDGILEVEVDERYKPTKVKLLAGNNIDGFSDKEINAEVDCLGLLSNVTVTDPKQEKNMNCRNCLSDSRFLMDKLELYTAQFREANPYNIRKIFSIPVS